MYPPNDVSKKVQFFLRETFHLGSDVQIRLDGLKTTAMDLDAFLKVCRSDEPLCVFWRPHFFSGMEFRVWSSDFYVHFKNSCVFRKGPPFCTRKLGY